MRCKIVLALVLLAIVLTACGRESSESSAQPGQPEAAPVAPPIPKTVIQASGAGGMEMTIAPSTDKTVTGVITITMTSAPAETKAISFAMQMQGSEPVQLGVDSDASDGWSLLADTSKYPNGIYNMGGVALVKLEPGAQPIGVASAQVVIQN